MALRYSGDVTIELHCEKRHGEIVYLYSLRAMGHALGKGVVHTGIAGGLRATTESAAYDKAASEALQQNQQNRSVQRYAEKRGRSFEVVRTMRSPCPIR